jgi:hypothetical protein
MKKILSLFSVVLCCLALNLQAKEEPIVLALWDTIQWPAEQCDLRGLRLEVYGKVDNHVGLTLGIANATLGDTKGATFGFANLNEGEFRGFQWGFFNDTQKDFYGWQSSWIGIAQKDICGLQDGLFVYDGGTVKGAQIAFVTAAQAAKGVQFGLCNFTYDMTGLQFGVVNYTEQMNGVQIGLVNIIRNSKVPVFPFVNFYFN